MPINPNLVPSIPAGTLFTRLTTDPSLSVRYLQPNDPAFYDVLNRPTTDIELRQLIIAKTVDDVTLKVGHQLLYPFIIQPYLETGSAKYPVPTFWIWDMHISVPYTYELVRLSKIERVTGTNNDGSGKYTGKLRLFFTAQPVGDPASQDEEQIFTADYQIDSTLTYQVFKIANTTDNTIAGYLCFRTLDTTDPTIIEFLDLFQPKSSTTGSNDEYTDPTTYEIASSDESAGNDFYPTPLIHGTGVLLTETTNQIPASESDFGIWLTTNNYPFRIGMTRKAISADGITIPNGIFSELSILSPSPDRPTGDTTKLYYPVWISQILRLNNSATQLSISFSTYDYSGTPTVIGTLTLSSNMTAGSVVTITTTGNLLGGDTNANQQFGSGHVVLGQIWGTTVISNFFSAFSSIAIVPPAANYNEATATLSSYSTSRNSKYSPTKGQFAAAAGSTARLTTPIPPSDSNRFVTEQDVGLGNAVDLEAVTGITPHPAIAATGYTGSNLSRSFKLTVDTSSTTPINYQTDILPRIIALIGRAPVFGDRWFDSTVWKTFNGDSWTS